MLYSRCVALAKTLPVRDGYRYIASATQPLPCFTSINPIRTQTNRRTHFEKSLAVILITRRAPKKWRVRRTKQAPRCAVA